MLLNNATYASSQYLLIALFTESPVSPGTVMFSNGVPYTYQNGMAVFASPETGYAVQQAQVVFITLLKCKFSG